MGKQVEFGIRVSVNGNKAAVDGIEEITKATKRSGDTAQESANKSIAAQQKLEREQQLFLNTLSRKVDAIGKTNSQLALMRAQELGVADSASHLISKLAATEVGVNRVGMSSSAMSAAMRNVPAQFTDIVVSLQAGQSPMQVFLQQGGQLKDMFGGMGGAAKALGSYVVGLVTPFTVAAAAVGVLTLAYYQGSQELTNYQRAIILTNNITGVSASRVADMAKNINSAGDISKAAAAEALTAILNTGSVAADNLERFAAVAAKMQKTVGKSVGETAKELSELAKSPLEASKKLDEQYNYLNKSIYDQIKALQQQGRTAEAAALAQKTYIDSFDSKAAKIKDNLGYVESGWNSVKSAATGAWDAILNVGRQSTNGDQLDRVKTQIANKQLYRDQKQASGDTTSKIYKNLVLEIAALEAQAKSIQLVIDKENGLAEATAKVVQENKKSIASAEKLDAYLNSGSRQTKAQALAEEAKRFAEATAGFDKTSKEYRNAEAANALAVKDINERFKEKNTEFKKQENAYQTLITSIKEKLAVSQAELLQNTNLTEGQKLRIKFDNDLREGKITATAAEREFARSLTSQIDLNAILATAEKDQLARSQALKDEFLARFNANTKMLEANDAYIESLSASNEQAQLEVTLLGKTEQERKIAIEQFKVELALRKQIKEIEKSKGFDDDKKKAIQTATNAANVRKEQIVLEVNTEEITKARKELDAFLDPAKAQSFGEALAGAFGNAGNALQKLSANLQEYGRTEAELAKARANAELGRASNPIKYAQDIAAINERSARAQINNYANIAGAAKNFFSEGTRGYKALEAAENAFRVVQLASDLAKGMSAAAVGIASQAQGDPYTALPRMAEMAAVMASLGFATGFFGSGGSGGGKSAAQMQKEQGTGSVFGDLTAKSESITKSIEEMSRTSNRLLPVNEGMLVALKNIESSMAGFTNLVVRDQGVVDGTNLGIRTGTIDRSSMSTVTAVLLTGIMAPVTKWLAGLWGKTTQNVVDSGVQFGGRLSDLQVGKGFAQYASVDTTSSSWFGLKKSTSNSVQSQALSSELSGQLGLIFSNMSVALKEANKALGGSATEIEKTLADLTLSSSKVSLKGLTGQALTEALNGVISKSLDEMAQAAFPAYDKFREVGEGYAQTVLRVANTFSSVNQIVGSINLKIFEAGQAGIEASVGFEKLMGGLENLQSVSSSYLENFFSEKERADKIRAELTTALSGVGVAMPTDRDGYRQAVEKASAEGRQDAVAVLLKLNEAFASIVPAAENLIDTTSTAKAKAEALLQRNEAIQKQIDDIVKSSMSLTEQRELEHKGMEKSTLDLQLRYEALLDEKAASEKAKAAMESLKATNDAIQAKIDDLVKAGMSQAQQRELEHKGMAKSTLDLQLRYEALLDEAAASEKAKAAMDSLKATNDAIQAKIDDLVKAGMSQAQQRELEHKGMAKSTLDLQLRYEALLDEAAASEKAKAAMDSLNATNEAIQRQIDEIVNASLPLAQQRALEVIGVHDTTKALKEKLWAAQDAQQAAKDAASAEQEARQSYNQFLSDVKSAFKREASVFESTIDKFTALAKGLEQYAKKLTTGPRAMLNPEAAYQASREQFYSLVAAIDRDDKEALEQFQSVSDAFLELSEVRNASGAAYFADLNAVKAATNKAALSSYEHVDVAKTQLKYLEQQVQGLVDINESVQSLGSLLRGGSSTSSTLADGVHSGSGMSASEAARMEKNVRQDLENAGGFDSLYAKTKDGDANAMRALQNQLIRWSEFGLNEGQVNKIVGDGALKKVLDLFKLRIEDYSYRQLTSWDGNESRVEFGLDGLHKTNWYAEAADRLKVMQDSYIPPAAYIPSQRPASQSTAESSPAFSPDVELMMAMNENLEELIRINSGTGEATVRGVSRLNSSFESIGIDALLAKAAVKV